MSCVKNKSLTGQTFDFSQCVRQHAKISDFPLPLSYVPHKMTGDLGGAYPGVPQLPAPPLSEKEKSGGKYFEKEKYPLYLQPHLCRVASASSGIKPGKIVKGEMGEWLIPAVC